MLKIEHINEDEFERIFVFGDLHGCLNLFNQMIEKINLTKQDLIIILGDSCDRGEHSIALYERYLELIKDGYQIKHIMGNHEELLYYGFFEVRLSNHYTWIQNGGRATQKEIEDRGLNSKKLKWLKEYIESMPHMISSDKSLFVHASYNTKVSSEEKQDKDHLMWRRWPFWLYNNTGKGIYYGHTPNKDGDIHERENSVYSMDCGAVFFNRLVIMEIKSKEKFSVGA